jgi:hypothetical protein
MVGFMQDEELINPIQIGLRLIKRVIISMFTASGRNSKLLLVPTGVRVLVFIKLYVPKIRYKYGSLGVG